MQEAIFQTIQESQEVIFSVCKSQKRLITMTYKSNTSPKSRKKIINWTWMRNVKCFFADSLLCPWDECLSQFLCLQGEMDIVTRKTMFSFQDDKNLHVPVTVFVSEVMLLRQKSCRHDTNISYGCLFISYKTVLE